MTQEGQPVPIPGRGAAVHGLWSHSFLLPVLLPNTVNAGWEYFVLCHAAGERTGKWYTSPRGLLNISGYASLLGIQRSKQNRKVTDVHNFKTQIVENS